MKEFAQKFADLTIEIRKANTARDAAQITRVKARDDLDKLIRGVKEFVSGVYDVESGHVVIDDNGNIFFYETDDG